MSLNAESGKWFKNSTIVAMVIAFSLGSFYVSGYVKSVDNMEEHVKGYPARLENYNKIISDQHTFNLLIKKDIESAEKHRIRLETLINQLNAHLGRLQLVSENEPLNQNDKNKEKNTY